MISDSRIGTLAASTRLHSTWHADKYDIIVFFIYFLHRNYQF